jgi:hypothetical protein
MDNPVVENAEMHSNSRCAGCLAGSKIIKSMKAERIKNRERTMMESTRMIVDDPISLLPISSRRFPRKKLTDDLRASASVVVLIPPPVDPGDAPTHIKNMVKNKVG